VAIKESLFNRGEPWFVSFDVYVYIFNATLGWWWADPTAGYVLVCHGARGAKEAFAH